MTFTIEVSEQVSYTEINGKLVLFSRKSGDFFGLNQSAKDMLDRLSTTDLVTVATDISSICQVDKSMVEKDLNSLVDTLVAKALVTKKFL